MPADIAGTAAAPADLSIPDFFNEHPVIGRLLIDALPREMADAVRRAALGQSPEAGATPPRLWIDHQDDTGNRRYGLEFAGTEEDSPRQRMLFWHLSDGGFLEADAFEADGKGQPIVEHAGKLLDPLRWRRQSPAENDPWRENRDPFSREPGSVISTRVERQRRETERMAKAQTAAAARLHYNGTNDGRRQLADRTFDVRQALYGARKLSPPAANAAVPSGNPAKEAWLALDVGARGLHAPDFARHEREGARERILKVLAHYCPDFAPLTEEDADRVEIERIVLPFLPRHDFVEIHDSRTGRRRRSRFLVADPETMPAEHRGQAVRYLGGKSDVLHEIMDLGWSIDDPVKAASFITFFAGFIEGDQGNFLIVENEAGMPWRPGEPRRNDPNDPTVAEGDRLRLDALVKLARPLTIERLALESVTVSRNDGKPYEKSFMDMTRPRPGDTDAWIAGGAVLYGQHLFYAELAAEHTDDRARRIQMLDDVPILSELATQLRTERFSDPEFAEYRTVAPGMVAVS